MWLIEPKTTPPLRNLEAVTTKPIHCDPRGFCIPQGVHILVDRLPKDRTRDPGYAFVMGLPITQLYHDEYKITACTETVIIIFD